MMQSGLLESHGTNSFSNLIDLRLFFAELPDYVVIKLPEHFPNYNDYEDIDIICADAEQMCSRIVSVGQQYVNKGFEIQVHQENGHFHVDFYPPGAQRLNFRFDLLSSLDVYRKIVVDPGYHTIVLASKHQIIKNGTKVFVPSLEHELVVRLLEYLEWKDEIPSKIKHLNYIINQNNQSFFPIVNEYTNLFITTDEQQQMVVRYKAEMETGSKQRMDYFMIWGHGLPYTNQILEIIRNNPSLEIVTIVRKHIDDIAKFVQDIYACDTVPFYHLIDKTRYLLTTKPEIIFVLTINKDPQEKYFGEGEFRHIQSQLVKDIKEEIRNKFNPRDGNRRTENHVIHASDYESQVEHVLQVLGLPALDYYKREPHPDIDAPYHLGKIEQYEIIEVPIDSLCASILERGLQRIQNTPHYAYVAGEKGEYLEYHRKHLGSTLTDDHFPEAYDKMIENFSYNGDIASGKQNLIIAKKLSDGRYQILDGVHRAAVLAFKGIKNVQIALIAQEEQNFFEAAERMPGNPALAHDAECESATRDSQSWLHNNFHENYEIIRQSIDMFMYFGTLSIGRQETLADFFQNSEELWQRFIGQILDKTCLEIGSAPCGVANHWHFIRKWHVIAPCADEYKQMTMNMFGKTWWWHWIKTHSQSAEKLLPELIGQIDGVIVCTNVLDHVDDPVELLNNIARYAVAGCKLLLWTDLYHLHGHDKGLKNVCRSRELFKTMLTNRGFHIEYETPAAGQGKTIEFGCVATKI